MENISTLVENLRSRKQEIESRLGDPAVVADQPTFQQLSKEHSHLTRIVEKHSEYAKVSSTLAEDRRLLSEASEDDELRSMLEEEIASLEQDRDLLLQELQDMLRPDSKDDDRDTIVEIRAGTGGAEASLFAGDLFRMYSRYADSQGWRLVTMNSHPTELGGFKEIVFEATGKSVYRKLKFESGVHRVQRIPVTEAGGRIHTSAVSVAVLPEPSPVEVEIDPKDIRTDVFRASGHGGQSVNTMDSAVRITHLPTKIVVQCQDERSQRQNKEKAIRHLRAKLLKIEQARQEGEAAQARREQIRSGDRSEKIRTYNFPQNRVTDHRIGLTVYALDSILDGDLDQLILPSLNNQRKAADLGITSRP
jgi:peptide chain release factor 1